MAKSTGPYFCGFCNTGFHENCKVVARNGSAAPNPLVWCSCAKCVDKSDHPFCIDCGNKTEQDVDAVRWTCIDQVGCKARITAKVDADPVIQKVRDTRVRANMVKVAENAEKAAKAPAAPKVGVCLVTGKPTKGGKFLPGMDARYVSLRVAEVIEGKTTAPKVLAAMKAADLSESLQSKFTKNLGIAQEKADKAKKAAADKKAADKAKAATATK